jgi:hypothetical protein
MTAEIAVMNKFGIAIASDSAIIVEAFHDNKLTKKVHNSANKLFTLSKFSPVAIMFYNTVTLGGVPWETIVKSYRRNLGNKTFPKLSDYSQDFFRFICSNRKLFPEENLSAIFFQNIIRSIHQVHENSKTRTEFVNNLDDAISDLEQKECIEDLEEEYAKAVCVKFRTSIEAAIRAILPTSYAHGNKRKINQYIHQLIQRKSPLEGYSGLVFAGFGEDEYFPKLEEYVSDLHLGDKVRRWKKTSFEVSHLDRSEIIPFADTEVIHTLINGLSPTFESQAIFSALKLILEIPKSVLGNVTELTNTQRKIYLDAARKALPQQFEDHISDQDKFREKNYTRPIKSSIASLPISELGSVAEVLLNTSQILKKVNPDIETVGGPVDVAVISKGDGFVWIKRKHYFRPELNHSFFDRYLHA